MTLFSLLFSFAQGIPETDSGQIEFDKPLLMGVKLKNLISCVTLPLNTPRRRLSWQMRKGLKNN